MSKDEFYLPKQEIDILQCNRYLLSNAINTWITNGQIEQVSLTGGPFLTEEQQQKLYGDIQYILDLKNIPKRIRTEAQALLFSMRKRQGKADIEEIIEDRRHLRFYPQQYLTAAQNELRLPSVHILLADTVFDSPNPPLDIGTCKKILGMPVGTAEHTFLATAAKNLRGEVDDKPFYIGRTKGKEIITIEYPDDFKIGDYGNKILITIQQLSHPLFKSSDPSTIFNVLNYTIEENTMLDQKNIRIQYTQRGALYQSSAQTSQFHSVGNHNNSEIIHLDTMRGTKFLHNVMTAMTPE